MGFLPVNEQMDLIGRGVEEIIPEDELVRKLERSQSKNIPLIIIRQYDNAIYFELKLLIIMGIKAN